MTVALYCRVSTEEQAQQGFSLDAQHDRLIAYCKSQGWNDYEIYSDDGYTGTNMDRPALKKLIRHIERGVIQSVVVYRLDRLSRRQSHCLYLLEEVFDKHNVTFKSATEPFDTSTPLGKAMLGILAVFAQLERETIIERTKEGHYKRARSGLWGGGPQPFGYSWNKDEERLEVEPREAQVVSGIFRKYLAGEPLQAIAQWAAKRSKEKWWDHTVVKNILRRDTYVGVIQYGSERAEGQHEAIIDMETFQRTQKELQKRHSGKRPVGKYLLSGMLRCGECGEPIVGQVVHRSNKTHYYYVCANKQQGKSYYKQVPSCSSHHFHMGDINERIIHEIQNVATDPEALLMNMNANTDMDHAHQLQQLQSELGAIEKRLTRWYDLYDEDSISKKELGNRVHALEHEKARLELLIEELQDEAESIPDTQPFIDALHAIDDLWDTLTEQERQSILRSLIQQVRIYKDTTFEIEWNI